MDARRLHPKRGRIQNPNRMARRMQWRLLRRSPQWLDEKVLRPHALCTFKMDAKNLQRKCIVLLDQKRLVTLLSRSLQRRSSQRLVK
tara:strand:- start:360 stop:620 length:261 start_codon:yes stop_codon:yes gene_type:complete